MPERLKVTPLEARIALVNEVYEVYNPRDPQHRGQYSEAMARALHGNVWRSYFHPERKPLRPEDLMQDAQRSQLFMERVDQAIATLTEREQARIHSRFGIDTGEIKLLDEVGNEIGRSRERARQILAKAFRKLRHPSRSNLFKEFLPE